MSERRICKYCGMELSEDVPHGLRQCHLHAVARIAELEEEQVILKDQMREAKNILIDKRLHIDSLYEDGFKLQKRIAELEAGRKWIPVSERLPEEGELVFVIIHDGFERFEDGNEVARLTYLGNGNWWSWESVRYVVTHWMPLPELPEEREE